MLPRHVYIVAFILTLSAAYGCWCQAPLIWDGAYQFDATLALQHPYVYLTRFHTFLLWYPTVWASHITSNVNLLQAIYGLPFLLAPCAGLLLSWWIVRRHAPYLMIWVTFGVAASTVPGQIFVINDSMFQLHLFWPIFVAMFVPLDWPKRIVLAVLVMFEFAHPLGVPLLFGAAASAGLLALVDRTNRRRLLVRAAVMLVLCALATGKIIYFNHQPRWVDKYAQEEATWDNALARWRAAVPGSPLNGLKWMWAAAALLWVQGLLGRWSRGLTLAAGILAGLCVVRAASYWFYWAHGPDCFWGGAIDYRRWVGPLAAPFFILATAEAMLRGSAWQRDSANAPRSASSRTRGLIAVMVGLTFAITLAMQYTTWHQRAQQLMAAVRSYPRAIVPNTDPLLHSWIIRRSRIGAPALRVCDARQNAGQVLSGRADGKGSTR